MTVIISLNYRNDTGRSRSKYYHNVYGSKYEHSSKVVNKITETTDTHYHKTCCLRSLMHQRLNAKYCFSFFFILHLMLKILRRRVLILRTAKAPSGRL